MKINIITIILSIFTFCSVLYFMIADDYSLLLELIFNIIVFFPSYFLLKFTMKKRIKSIRIIALIYAIFSSLHCINLYILNDFSSISSLAHFAGVMSAYFIYYIKNKNVEDGE